MVELKRSEDLILSFMRYMLMKRSLVASLWKMLFLLKGNRLLKLCPPRFLQSQSHPATATHAE